MKKTIWIVAALTVFCLSPLAAAKSYKSIGASFSMPQNIYSLTKDYGLGSITLQNTASYIGFGVDYLSMGTKNTGLRVMADFMVPSSLKTVTSTTVNGNTTKKTTTTDLSNQQITALQGLVGLCFNIQSKADTSLSITAGLHVMYHSSTRNNETFSQARIGAGANIDYRYYLSSVYIGVGCDAVLDFILLHSDESDSNMYTTITPRLCVGAKL
ncbi:MAG: hypothetical protein MJ183_08950 [Treponemataceae bacterium]|nr:hypothetical protein [Treponemataceae bacterium]